MRELLPRLRRAFISVRTLRARLTLWYVALLALTLVAFSTFLYLRLESELRAAGERALAAEAQREMATIDVQNGRPSIGGGTDQAATGMALVLTDATATVLDTAGPPLTLPLPRATLRQAAAGHATLRTVQLLGNDWQVRTQPVTENGRLIGILQVAQSQQVEEAALWQLKAVIALAIPMTLLAASAGGWFLASRALGPVDRVTRTAQRLGAEDLSARLHLPETHDEVGRLAATFDGMLDRLERAFQQQRQFTADAAHELRTPLALLTSRADVALERPRHPAEYRRVLTELRADADRMTQLLSAMLTLARADRGREELVYEEVDLAALVDDVTASMQPLAATRSVELSAGELAPLVVPGDQTRLTQLLVNLLENAIKYTLSRGKVQVSLAQTADGAVLTVSDGGIGIAPEHLPHLFERFYRVDPARGAGGAGLGLAICRWIVEAHGGQISAASSVGIGTVVTVQLPCRSPGSRTAGNGRC